MWDTDNLLFNHHLAKHIILSLDGDLICTINSNGDLCCKGIIIDSSVLHTVQSRNNKLLVFLIDEASSLAQDMKKTYYVEHLILLYPRKWFVK